MDFTKDQSYTFGIRSFRYRNGFCFCTVTVADATLEILIGATTDYPLAAMLQAKQMGASIYGTFKEMHSHNGVEYPRFWDVSVG